jgi:putative restriction endonuclease
MKEGQKLWSRDELILAINLYCKLSFGKMHKGNLEIIALANLINRTPSSVALKLVNFASLDPSLKARGIKGAQNSSKLDKEIWNEYYLNWEELAFKGEKLRANFEKVSLEAKYKIEDDFIVKEGKEREQLVKLRVNQNFFRATVLSSYNCKCCITGMEVAEDLVAGHIVPWGKDKKNRLNPRNGILINSFHDKAFECGLLTITPDYRVKVSSTLKQKSNDENIGKYFLDYDDKEIYLPSRFLPDPEFLKYHNNERFKI